MTRWAAWEERRNVNMYKYVEDKQFLSRMRSLCGEIMQDLCHTLKEEYDIGASFYLVGSGARNLILQNANQPIDLDYNLEITRIDDWEDCKEIKECVRKAFNIVLREYGWSDCQDSTSSLTTEKGTLIREIVQNFQWIFVLFARIQTETIIALFTIRDVFQTDISGIKHLIQETLERKQSISKKKENGH